MNEKMAPPSISNKLLAPVIACILAAAVLLGITLVPGVLGYPEDGVQSSPAEIAVLAEVQKVRNEQLRLQIKALEEALNGGMCIDNGQFSLPSGPMPAVMQSVLPVAPPAITEACSEASDQSMTVEALADRATVLVARLEGNEIKGFGTGFFIRPGEVLTNAHVVKSKEAKLLIYSGAVGAVNAQVVAIGGSSKDNAIDLAVLSVPEAVNKPHTVLKFANAERSDRIRSVGYPGHIVKLDPAFIASLTNPTSNPPSKEPVIDGGDVVIKQNEGVTGTWIYHSAYIDHGNSGGPLIDVCGRVVGVNTAIQSSATKSDNPGEPGISSTIGKALAFETVESFFRDNGLVPPAISVLSVPKVGG